VRPLLYFAYENKAIANTVKAVIERQAMYIALDPYANAFRDDFTVWERKFELDSLSYPILLVWTYWKVTGDNSVFTPSVKLAFSRALETMLTEQDHDGVLPGHKRSGYHFKSDTQSSGKLPVGYTGMIWVAFRPSDDECLYNFPIPVEIQAVQALNALAEMERFIGRMDMARTAETLGKQVKAGIEQYGIVDTPDYGRLYAYEVDGLGHANLMDDANIPSLLSIPYFGYVSEMDEIYMATRRFILSPSNPYFYEGTFKGEEISGIGSPHTPAGMIWPLAQEMQGMTTNQRDEQIRVLRMLLASDPGDHQPHESYAADNPKHFTRKDFGWAKAQFAEFVLRAILGRMPLPVPPKPEMDPYVTLGHTIG
jgi:meiotically up-regulated gene 157 (Mug157) protein